MLLLLLLAVLPPAGEAMASMGTSHCAPAMHAMTMDHAQMAIAGRHDCDHGSPHRQLPCAMMGLCTMTGCMAVTAVSSPEAMAAEQAVAFLVPNSLPVDGLAHAPPLEPPRA